MSDEGFLSRWSRLKRTGTDAPATDTPATAPPAAEIPAADTPATDRPVPAAPAPPPLTLPPLTLEDVAGLNPDGDFTPFLKADVAPEVHRAALRKLWASDPIITTHDGLTDYAEDFSIDPNGAALVRTIWNAGQNIVGAAGTEDDGKDNTEDLGDGDGEAGAPIPEEPAPEEPPQSTTPQSIPPQSTPPQPA